jgi:hypothetical protein
MLVVNFGRNCASQFEVSCHWFKKVCRVTFRYVIHSKKQKNPRVVNGCDIIFILWSIPQHYGFDQLSKDLVPVQK